jgi:hypothetical protein
LSFVVSGGELLYMSEFFGSDRADFVGGDDGADRIECAHFILEHGFHEFNGFRNLKLHSSSSSSSDYEENSETTFDRGEFGVGECGPYNALSGINYWCEEEFIQSFDEQLRDYEESTRRALEEEAEKSGRYFYSTDFLLSLQPKATSRPVFLTMNVPYELLKKDETKLW